MLTQLARSPYWESKSASETRQRISDYEQERTSRPTVVVPITDYANRPLLVLDANTRTWQHMQGHIEPSDPDPVTAAAREIFEEGYVTAPAVEHCIPYLGETRFIQPQPHETGFSQGGYYIFVGIKLKPGADVSVKPPPGCGQALLERKWCSSLDHAIEILRTQPGVENVTPRTRFKIETVLIPALESLYQPQASWMLETLEPIM